MQIKTFFLNRLFLGLHIQTGHTLRRSVKRVGYKRGNRAEGERWEIKNTGRQNLVGRKPRIQRADLEVLEAVPPFVELRRGLFLGAGSDRWDGVFWRVGFGGG